MALRTDLGVYPKIRSMGYGIIQGSSRYHPSTIPESPFDNPRITDRVLRGRQRTILELFPDKVC